MHINPADRSPKGDHNRRLSLGLDTDQFAYAAGVTVDELRDYENAWPEHHYSSIVAERVGDALDRLETVLPNSEAAGQMHEHLTVPEALAMTTDPTFEQRVRDWAYLMWERDGRPEGRDPEYWRRAREACIAEEEPDASFERAPDPAITDVESGKPIW